MLVSPIWLDLFRKEELVVAEELPVGRFVGGGRRRGSVGVNTPNLGRGGVGIHGWEVGWIRLGVFIVDAVWRTPGVQFGHLCLA